MVLAVQYVEVIFVLIRTLNAFYIQYPPAGPSMPMPTPGGPAMYPGMSSHMPPGMSSQMPPGTSGYF